MKLGIANDLHNLFIDLRDPLDRVKQATLPIHTLPTELLITILELAIEPHEWSLAVIRNLARVCKRWNSIIRSQPRLWTIINGGARIKDIRVAIRKARTSQLALVCQYAVGQSSKWPSLVSVLVSKAPELWSIDMEVPLYELRRDWNTISKLTSQVTHCRLHATETPYRPQQSISLDIPQGRQFRLLDLSYVAFNWSSPRLSGLIVLHLDSLWGLLSGSHITKILQTSPDLEELMFSSITLQPQSEEGFVSTNIISLPSLKSFNLTSVDSSFNELLSLLRIPATTTIELEAVDIRGLTIGNDPLIFRVIPPVLPSAPCIAASITRQGCSLAVPNASGKWVHHEVYGRYGGAPLLAALRVGRCAPLITRLDVDMKTDLDGYPVETFGRFQNLESLTLISGSWIKDVLNLISRPSSFDGRWPCPKLSDLEVGFRYYGKCTWMAVQFRPSDGRVLQDAILARWGGQNANGPSPLAATPLRSFRIRVPEILEAEEDLDALASLACNSARMLGFNVVRVISIFFCLHSLAIDSNNGPPPPERLTPPRTSEPAPPIHLLPSETLIQILGLAIDDHQWSLPAIRDLAGVCKRWNLIVRSHPTLWAVINGSSSVEDIKLAIRKAKTQPLSLVYRPVYEPPRWPDLLQTLDSTRPELWSIDIAPFVTRTVKYWGTIAPLISQLTHLRIHPVRSSISPAYLTMPPGRQLRVLDIKSIILDWDNPRLSGLVILRLDCLRVPITASQMMRILRSSPALEEVTLSVIKLEEMPNGHTDCDEIISLPFLKSFRLRSASDSFNQILPLLRLPASATIRLIDADIKALTLGNDPPIFRIIPPTLPSAPGIEVRITDSDFSLVTRNASAERVRYSVSHSIDYKLGGIDLLEPLQVGCCGPLVTRLDVDLETHLDRYPVESLERLCNLEVLRVHSGAWVKDVLDFLSQPLKRERGQEAWPCPELNSLDVGCTATGLVFTPDDGLGLQNLLEQRWGGQDTGAATYLGRARLDWLTVWVLEDFDGPENLDALAWFACKVSKTLRDNVVRIVSTTPW